jgi:hypothetical protein
MGQYSHWKGDIKFKTKKDFDTFLNKIIENGWYLKDKDIWNDDGAGYFDENNDCDFVDDDNLTITLPDLSINNFARVINLLEANTWEGQVVGVTDDGDYAGWVVKPDMSEDSFDLEEWAKHNGHELAWDEDNEDFLTDDRISVMEEFLENPYPPANSTKFISND